MKPVRWKDICHQIGEDLIGKDSYRGVTLSYSWLANQFGHFSLGFIPVTIFFCVFKYLTKREGPAFTIAMMVAVAWLLFELYNFLWPLLHKRNSRSNLLYLHGEKYVFEPKWGNIAFDTATDICFFWFGTFSASLLLQFSWASLIIIAVLVPLLVYPAYYWYSTKIYQQNAQYPFQFRLSQWSAVINEKDKQTVVDFLSHAGKGKHLLVFGSKNSGKTSISVGIANELSIKHHNCMYTTAIKLYSMFFDRRSNAPSLMEELWSWRSSTLLIIDDINPGDPIKEELVSPAMFMRFIDRFSDMNDDNRRVIKNKCVIWVLGSAGEGNCLLQQWRKMLFDIGVDEHNIVSINLLNQS